jgi:Family of unknown function (DUF5906)
MMDFFRVCTRESRKKGGPIEVYADYTVGRSRDLMVQGGGFYAIWDEKKGLWSRDEYDVAILVDQKIREKVEELEAAGTACDPKYLTSFDNGRWEKFRKFVRSVSDNSHPLDTKVTFANAETKRSDYVSRRLPYSLSAGPIKAYEELVSKLYDPEERAKFEWGIGAILSGDAKRIQKFLVFYGSHGTGKSTVLDLISQLFGGKVPDGGYVAHFDAQALTGNGNTFATSAFKDNPLVAIQHDGDLSKIETNARLNSIVSHEEMTINEKFKATYDNKINALLFMGTNKPVQITDAKSGLIRRLIDVNPTGKTHDVDRYHALMKRIDFELGAIAHHCLQVYQKLGRNAYSQYVPENMMMKTDVFRNYVEEHFDIFKEYNGTTLKQAWELYKEYCVEAQLPYKSTMIKFREELKNYFDDFQERAMLGGVMARKVYLGFNAQQFKAPVVDSKTKEKVFSLVMEETTSLFDEMYAGVPAQYGNDEDNPKLYWDDSERYDKKGKPFTPKKSQICSTVLGDLITTKLHFVNLPEYHIVIDFDLRDEDGNKSLERSLEAASEWPPTYAEISKSGDGVHLHYIYDGDTDELANEYSPGIEIKVYRGNGSLRRKLTKCNNIAVATISSGLPFREKKVLAPNALQTEDGLRKMIINNMRKQYHPGTKPSIDFIAHLLEEAHRDGLVFDVSDMKQDLFLFANNSRNQAPACIKTVNRMRLKSDITPDEVDKRFENIVEAEKLGPIVFFDCEVYKNLFVVCWKYLGSDQVVRMINPSPSEIENLLKMRLVGFNNRGYDNHILWARHLHASNEDLYKLSQRIIVDNDDKAKYGAAWAASYADVYDFSVQKKGLKKWEIELGIPHVEMDIPWDEPVPDDKIDQVVDYCCNDVMALEAVWNHLKQDFAAREILANMSGLTVNNSTRQHVMRILFGRDQQDAKKKFVYTDLAEMFPGYVFDKYSKTEKSKYKGRLVGEGGLVLGKPGMYENVAVLDIASMHPTSIIELNLFGPYTKMFQQLMEARLALKHDDRAAFEKNLPGVAWPETKEDKKALSEALKLVLNSTYGYTCAKFDNPARDPRNIDNIVAKRGALFMVDLVEAVEAQGFTVAHVKTDSIKIPDATPDIIEFVKEFGANYGYTFEHEATYKKMCLVNDAVLVAYVGWNADEKPEHWKAVGAEFQHPFVFKTLFTDEPITFKDLCETKMVKEGAMYLRFPKAQKGYDLDIIVNGDEAPSLDYYDLHVGRSGMFVAISPDQDMFQGGQLLRIKDGKEYAVSGTKGYLWAESEMIRVLQAGAIERMVWENVHDAVQGTGSIMDVIDMAYYLQLAEDAAQSIEKYGDFEWFADRGLAKV